MVHNKQMKPIGTRVCLTIATYTHKYILHMRSRKSPDIYGLYVGLLHGEDTIHWTTYIFPHFKK